MQRLSRWTRLWTAIAGGIWLFYVAEIFFLWSQTPCAYGLGETSVLVARAHFEACEEAVQRGSLNYFELFWSRASPGVAMATVFAIGIWLTAITAEAFVLWVSRGFERPTRPSPP